MLSLFRKFRHGLLKERKFGTYLVYATGEILLIIVGILAALWIDGWNQDRQEAQREAFYLEGLQAEFEQNRAKLTTLIEANRASYSNARVLADIIGGSVPEPSEAELSQLLYKAFSEDMDFNPSNSLLEEMINSGRLEILSNTELRKHLTAWGSRVDRIRQQEFNLREERDRTMNRARSEDTSVRSILENTGVATGVMELQKSQDPGSNKVLLQSREFENNTLLFILTAISTEQVHYEPLLEEIETILELIGTGKKG